MVGVYWATRPYDAGDLVGLSRRLWVVTGMFYMDANFQICFQRTSDLSAAQTEHLYHLRLECMGHPEQEGFYKIIAVELERRREELLIDEEMYWMKDQILSDAAKARLEALVDQ